MAAVDRPSRWIRSPDTVLHPNDISSGMVYGMKLYLISILNCDSSQFEAPRSTQLMSPDLLACARTQNSSSSSAFHTIAVHHHKQPNVMMC
ncbi:hypothetical protein BLOT_013615 [Blomia tropicalis]|nr:hypothetical protein BLOT_013615 [Blomia tropicalis]